MEHAKATLRGRGRNAKTFRKDLENCVAMCDMATQLIIQCLAALVQGYFCDLLQYSEN